MIYEVKSIPTRYKGINFRSKLEAQWAATLQRVGFKWTYEPYEVKGLVPDFIFYTKTNPDFPYILEIKPKKLITPELIIKFLSRYDDFVPKYNNEVFIGDEFGNLTGYTYDLSKDAMVKMIKDIGSFHDLNPGCEIPKNIGHYYLKTTDFFIPNNIFNDAKNDIQFKY